MLSTSINLYKQLADHKLFNRSVNFNLKRIKLVLKKLNNPQNKLKNVVQVAGTNGKGSVSTVPGDDSKVTFEKNRKNTTSSPYVLEKGIFKILKEKAEQNEDTDYFLIIDEINRGNISKILGELISLLEVKYRGPEHIRTLAYSKKEFFIPENLYIIGTMNTADKSLVQIDAALRRRFAFVELLPNPSVLDLPEFSKAKKYKNILENLNKKILKGRKEFRDKQVGHSYFLDMETDEDVQFIFKYEIIPLLQDYFYYDYGILREIIGDFIIMKDEDRLNEEIFESKNASKFVETIKKELGA